MLRPIMPRDHIRGPVTAPYTLVEYGDYECAHCGEAYFVIKEVQRQMEGELCFAFRNFPLVMVHPHAEHAAEAAEAAGVQGFFWEMHDALFENRCALDKDDIVLRAAALGLDAGRLISEVQSGMHAQRVLEDFQSGARTGIECLPALFVNGVRFEGPLRENALIAALMSNPYRERASLAL